jgi:hypothetical protein
MIHRLPVSEVIRPHVNSILILTLNLIREDNEENVLVCLRIIIDLHKQYRPAFYPQVNFENIEIFPSVQLTLILDQRFSSLHSKHLLQSSISNGQNLRSSL